MLPPGDPLTTSDYKAVHNYILILPIIVTMQLIYIYTIFRRIYYRN